MSSRIFLLSFLCSFTCTLTQSDLIITPCRRSDSACLNNIANVLYAATIRANPELGIESSDPLYQEYIGGDLPTIKYSFINSTLTGFKDCKVANTSITPNTTKIHFEMRCPLFKIFGQYEIDGKLINLPIEGNGDFRAETKDYRIYVDAKLKLLRGKDGTRFVQIKKFKSNAELLGGMDFDFQNLFNGRQELAEKVLDFTRYNWKDVSRLLQGPIFKTNIKRLITYSINTYLKTLPIEKIFID